MSLRSILPHASSPRPASAPILALVALAALLAGCSSMRQEWDVPTGPAYRPTNYTGVSVLPASVRRVVVLPLHSESWPASDLAVLEAAFTGELAKAERFEIVTVPRAVLREQHGQEAVMSSAALPADFLARLRASHGADAVLFQDLTHYSPYQPLAIGVRAKLVATVDGRILWAFDSLFDGAQPSVAVAARQYHLAQGRPAHPVDNSAGILQSPSRFAKYVAQATFGTLPPRQSR